jgi:hypothetical protein
MQTKLIRDEKRIVFFPFTVEIQLESKEEAEWVAYWLDGGDPIKFQGDRDKYLEKIRLLAAQMKQEITKQGFII